MRDSPKREQRDRRSNFVPLLALLLAVFSLIDLRSFGDRMAAMDFFVVWTMAQNAGRSDLADPYARSSQDQIAAEMHARIEREGNAPRVSIAAKAANPAYFTATPFLYTVFRVISGASYENNYQVFRHLCLAATLISLSLMAWLTGYTWTAILLWLTLVTQFFGPLRADIQVGNVQQLQLAQVSLYLAIWAWIHHRDDSPLDRRPADLARALAGLVLALSIAFKPTLVLIVPVAATMKVIHKRYRDLLFEGLGLLVGAVLAFLVGAWGFGSMSTWKQWWLSLRGTPSAIFSVELGNFATTRWISEQFGVPIGPFLAVLCGASILALIWRTRQRKNRAWIDDVYAVSFGCLLFLLSSPLAWLHYFLVTLPLFMLLLGPYGLHSWKRAPAMIGFALIALDPVKQLAPRLPPTSQIQIFQIGLLLLFLCSLWGFMESKVPKRYPEHGGFQ